MPLSEYEAIETNIKMLTSIVNEREIIKMTKWNGNGFDNISYVCVDKDELDKVLQDRVIQLEGREESYVKQIDEWNKHYKDMTLKIDKLEREKRMNEHRDGEFRKLVGKYDEVKRELDELNGDRVTGVRRFFRRFWR
jgi:hypothetical protein